MTEILTTHVGSMPRSQAVVDMLFAEDRGELTDRAAFDKVMRKAVDEIVKKQVAAGVDIVSDGEMSKISYATYIRHRLTGFEIGDAPRATPKDLDEFPEFRDSLAARGGTPKYHRPICRGPIAVKDLSALENDLDSLQVAVIKHRAKGAFMNAASPGVIAVFQPNEYYPSYESYLQALAEAMKEEYELIVSAGITLQIDCPDLAMGRHIKFRDEDDESFLRYAEMQVEALNYALTNIPASALRMHLCWGNYEGPHVHDIPLRKIFATVMRAKPQTILFEAANPRHAHEWKVWQEFKADIPEDKVLVPGVVDTTSNFVEHPELVAERLEHFIPLVGKDRVMAGSDCGFGTFAGFGAIHPSICWAKLKAMDEGAALASARLS
ncbi:MAG: cobalamin-independent methionine synthase II family protein [Deinococcales bacterium]